MIFTAEALGLFLRLMLARAGGSATFLADSEELHNSDDLQLFAEATDDGRGITLMVHRIDDTQAGHA